MKYIFLRVLCFGAFLSLLSSSLYSQTATLDSVQDIQLTKNKFCSVIEVNASWNWKNRIPLEKLENCYTAYIDLENKNIGAIIQQEWNIQYVPTVLIFKDGVEVARFEAGLSMKFSEQEILDKIELVIKQ